MIYAKYTDGVITGLFGCLQPDALDDDGNVICKGVETKELPEDHPDVVAFSEKISQPLEKPADEIDALLANPANVARLKKALGL